MGNTSFRSILHYHELSAFVNFKFSAKLLGVERTFFRENRDLTKRNDFAKN